ncbi:hypothetical protein PL11201_320021 [Planktothrix sp. PCC 11201]|uniref:type I-D CRISPR-associated protein Cas7/Csc2 n=1 Tax=Planktothrix sp. PCC 11201 TaxID=1729650 RepID=UPI0009143FAE|nr:hypothetical protein PL11201_320021 [Planktothrix sp. PCC 11201]
MKITLLPLYSQQNTDAQGCPLGCRGECKVEQQAPNFGKNPEVPCLLSVHQVETCAQVLDGPAEIIFNTSATGDGKSLAAYLAGRFHFPKCDRYLQKKSSSEGFIYVLGNLLRTRRYGAQESRTGTMTNHLVGLVFCDGEIFSNLHFTQAIYDQLKPDINAPISDILTKATQVADTLLQGEPVRKSQVILRPQLDELLTEVSAIYQDETRLRETLTTLYQQTKSYAETYGAFRL